ncbi:metallothionein [Corallococcus sicarius]|uniref:Metallothionein n=1 Tax=Corallococcus sicarius TaxID=2316726 RepID=A0A3A8NM73_9BACT|nr:metallothionein [Corallococcus sicarius]RKH41082.1 metallothionein [Corallococcus sicarius]
MARSATLRTAMTAGLLLGGLCWVPATAHACEAHAKAAASTQATGTKAKESAPRPLEELDKVLAAKCSCGSKADCTCKRGKCECSKCSGRHTPGQVTDALRGRPATQQLQEARYDASAGIFI